MRSFEGAYLCSHIGSLGCFWGPLFSLRDFRWAWDHLWFLFHFVLCWLGRWLFDARVGQEGFEVTHEILLAVKKF